jgi:hypothetical protein
LADKHIAGAADGADETRILGIVAEFAPQVGDVNVE